MSGATEVSILEDIIGPDLDVIFVGTAPSKISAQRGHYYSNPSNAFYRELHEAGFTDRVLRPEEDYLLPRYGVGLTDVSKRAAASDDSRLTESDWDREKLENLVRRVRPRCVCFTSKNAFRAWARRDPEGWGMQREVTISGVPVFVIPSPSGRVPAGRRLGGRTRLEWLKELRRWLNGEDTEKSSAQLPPPNGGGPKRANGCVDDIVAEILKKFRRDGKAPYLDGDGHLHYVKQDGDKVIVRRRHDNSREWKVPISALEEAVRQSCKVGRPLRSGECNEICNRRGTPLAILLRIVPDDRYKKK